MSEEGKTETVSKAEYDKAIERAQRFEAKFTDLEKQFNRFKDIDPDRVKADREALEQLEREKASSKPEEIEKLINRAKEDTRKEFGKKLEDYEKEIGTLRSQNHELTVVDKVFGAASGDLNDDMHDIFKDLARRACTLDAEGNIVVKDEKGEVRYSPKNPSIRMTHAEFIEELKESRGSMFKSTHKTGAKDTGTKGAASGVTGRTYTAAELSAMGEAKSIEIISKMTPEQIKATALAK